MIGDGGHRKHWNLKQDPSEIEELRRQIRDKDVLVESIKKERDDTKKEMETLRIKTRK